MNMDSLPAFEGYLSMLDVGAASASSSSSSASAQQWHARWCTLLDGALHVYVNRQVAIHRPYDILRVIALTPYQQLKVTGDYDAGGRETWDLTLVGEEEVQSDTPTPTASPFLPQSLPISNPASFPRTIPKSATNGSLSAMFTRLGSSTSSRTDEHATTLKNVFAGSTDEEQLAETGAQSNHGATWGRLTARSKRLRKLVASGMSRSSSNLSELRIQASERARASPAPSSLSSSYGGDESCASVSPTLLSHTLPHPQRLSQRHNVLTLRAPDSTSMVRWAEVLSACLKSNDQANRPVTFAAPSRVQAASTPADAPSHARSRRPMLSRVSSDAFYTATPAQTDDGDSAFSVVQAGMTSRRRRQASHSSGTDVHAAEGKPPAAVPLQRQTSMSSMRRDFRSHRRASLELLSKISHALISGNNDSTAETPTVDRRMSTISVSSSATARLDNSTCEASMPPAQDDEAKDDPPPHHDRQQQRRPSFGSGRLFSGSSNASSSSYVHSGTSHDTAVLTSPLTSSTPFSSSLASSSPCSPLLYFDNASSPTLEQAPSCKEAQAGPTIPVAPLLFSHTSSRANDEIPPALSSGPTGLGLDLGGAAFSSGHRRRVPLAMSTLASRTTKLSNNGASVDSFASLYDDRDDSVAPAMPRRASLIGGQEYATIVESPSLEDERIIAPLPMPGQETRTQRLESGETNSSLFTAYQSSSGMAARLHANPRYTSIRRLGPSPSMPSLKADQHAERNREGPLRLDIGKGNAAVASSSGSVAMSPRSKLQGARQMLMATARRRITSISGTKGSESDVSVDDGKANAAADASVASLSPQLLRYDGASPASPYAAMHRAMSAAEAYDIARFTTPPTVERILPPEEIIATIDRMRNERGDTGKEADQPHSPSSSTAAMPCSPTWTFATSSTATTKLHRSRTSPALNIEAAELGVSPALSLAGSMTPRMEVISPSRISLSERDGDSAASPVMHNARSLPVPPRSGRKARPRGNVDASADDVSATLSPSPDHRQRTLSPSPVASNDRSVLSPFRRPSAAAVAENRGMEAKLSAPVRDEQPFGRRAYLLEVPDARKGEATSAAHDDEQYVDDKENMLHSASLSVRSLQPIRQYATSSRRGSTATTASMSTSTSASAISYSRRGSAIAALPPSVSMVGVRGRRRSNTTATSSHADSKDRRKSISESYSFAIALAAAQQARKTSATPASRSTLVVD